MSKIIIAGLGPGSPEDMTPAVLDAVREADIVVGYKYYFRFVEPYLKPGCQCIDTGMKRERERAEQAFCLAEEGKTVVVISSGDAGIYGMAPLVYEMKRERGSHLDIVVLPGISAFQKAASLLGAPIGHDLCIISLSDLMTPWALIEKRIRAAAVGDFVTAVYNPKSHGRYWQLYRLRELFLLEGRSATTPVGIVRQAGRPEQEVTLTTLADLDPEQVDMFCVLIIGNSQSYEWQGKFITPRGYYRRPTPAPSRQGGEGLRAMGATGNESLPLRGDLEGSSPTVFSGEMHGGNWYAVGGKNALAQLFRDAGADYVIKDDNTGGVNIEFEQMYAQAADADYWRILNSFPGDFSYEALKASEPRNELFRAFREKHVIYCNMKQTPYYELAPVQPDVLLADLIAIFHPELMPADYEPTFYRLLR